ncbi:3-deoxy-7-phosphoheptulonate synthase [Vulcanisaeta souniana]|uniref:3-deoxy-7-phosphoheptulonate synthase n=1 Tax=Vulcanisaeta souniana JCM 11219 TaxID=1293586 RepID=A0A830EIL7_9CREN|nr:3-deoxy-7-phosphoheptulonate synthase [Vulcanisaeta souniana]BDR92366.1 3-deoxy-7-phosphoheptulonate synthase [Vulcanisaeta souniana JCM 11219]GGI75015.1 3-deoxy-7-phosphoheptulonate synthase [Vulcanisaeta souniana JCM 11219]
MIIKASKDRANDIASLLDKAKVKLNIVRIYDEELIVTWPDSKVDANAVKSVDPNAVVIEIKTKYQLVSNAWRYGTIVDVDGVRIGGNDVIVAAGPCAVEGYEQVRDTAIAVKEAGAKLLRGGAFKPRTNPYSFQGLGVEGLKILRRVRDEVGMPVVSEIMDVRTAKTMVEYVDMLQIGARNAQNFELLKEVGRLGKPVLLKRGLGNTVDEWLQAAEYVLLEGNGNVVLCERGIRTFEHATRFTLDLGAVAAAKKLTHLPICVDPSHPAGRRDLVIPLALAAIAAGADMLLVEVHPRPWEALSDAEQQLTFDMFRELMVKGREVARAIGRSL